MSSAAEAAYGGGVQKGALQQHQPQQPGPGALLYPHNGVAVYRKPAIPPFYQQPAASNAAAPTAPTHSSASAEPLKRKRGRPRKYGPADGAQPLAVVSPSQPAPAPADVGTNSGASPMLPPGFSPSPQGGGVVSPRASPAAAPPLPASNVSPAKKRGRPLGSTNKKPQPQAAAPGPGWAGLKPHDIASRAMSFSGDGWAVCILTANGAVSNVTLRQGDSSGGTVTYEVVIESFLADGKLELDPGSSPDKTVFSGFPTASSPSSRGTESSGGHGSPPNPAASFNTGSQSSFPNYPTWK
ncbi:hypothetical protein C2845_PM10G09340 [Panicum miliaceum]|uniref:AT-hook motif nuclear-localized protein n=1 Tax=Panicum miliaceum TaxID=4540 RepID=A0A3L6PE93_PANMI|nr:hypothetical protein C2845_PM10G09340 [Panicum miliaceum]